MEEFICCVLQGLPSAVQGDAANLAVMRCPANAPNAQMLPFVVDQERLALLTSRYWGAGGVDLSVAFLDTQDASLKDRILSHMNAWSAAGNVRFRLSSSASADVRITRTARGGYWSYLGTDIHLIPAGQPTMNLDSFTMQTPESEYRRVVRHETGHTLGFPHEHLRAALVGRIDRAKAIQYFKATQGWSEDVTVHQVLTPLEEAQLTATPADQTSIMCYQLPAAITTDGQPILGGSDINASDLALAARVYPPAVKPPAVKRLVVEFVGDYRIIP